MRFRMCDNTQRYCTGQYYSLLISTPEMDMSIADRLRYAMNEKGWSEGELSRRSGVHQPTINRILSGESKSPRRLNMERLARALSVSADWLFFGTQVQNKEHSVLESSVVYLPTAISNVAPLYKSEKIARKYPLISWVAAGSWQESCDNFTPGDAEDWIESPVNAGPHGYWLTVSGPSMQPKFDSGTLILVRPEGFDMVSGKYYIARLVDTGETTFKRYLRDGGSSYLQPLNQAFPIIPMTDNIEIIGRVVAAQYKTDDF